MRRFYREEPALKWLAYATKRPYRQGVFVELGAGDGLQHSNSLAFERKLGWTGLLIEPSEMYEELRVNRPEAICIKACVGHEKVKTFVEAGLNSGTTALHQKMPGNKSMMSCTPLNTLIDMHLKDLGGHIDYLSLDVEGSESPGSEDRRRSMDTQGIQWSYRSPNLQDGTRICMRMDEKDEFLLEAHLSGMHVHLPRSLAITVSL